MARRDHPVYSQRADTRRNDSAARWLRQADRELAETNANAIEGATLRCECGEMMTAGVDHLCQGRRPRKRMPWEYTGSARAKP